MRFALTWLVISITSGPAVALINGEIIQGSPDLVRIEFTNGWICSGAYVDPETILTAGHCTAALAGDRPLVLGRVIGDGGKVYDVRGTAIIAHPLYAEQFWPSHDLGIVKTTKNENFRGNFRLDHGVGKTSGRAVLYGCGRTQVLNGSLGRTKGENSYLQIASVLFFLGKSRPEGLGTGESVTVAPNDSGAPIVDKDSGMIIGVATTTTVKFGERYGLSALSTGTSTGTAENLQFILSHLRRAEGLTNGGDAFVGERCANDPRGRPRDGPKDR